MDWDWIARERRKHWMILTIGILMAAVMQWLEIKDTGLYSRSTPEAQIVEIATAPLSYLLILGAASYLVGWIWRDRWKSFGALAWLMLFSALCRVLTHKWTVTP